MSGARVFLDECGVLQSSPVGTCRRTSQSMPPPTFGEEYWESVRKGILKMSDEELVKEYGYEMAGLDRGIGSDPPSTNHLLLAEILRRMER